VGLETDIHLAKVSATQCLISQNHRIQQVNKPTATLPLRPQKIREREENERRAKRRNTRKAITPPLDPEAVSELVIGVLRWWAHTARGWPPLLLYTSGAHLIAFQKFWRMSQ